MDPVRALARPLLASVFVVDGLDSLRHPEKHAAMLEPYGAALDKAAETVPGLPAKRTVLVRVCGGASMAAGVLLAIGKAPRLAAATLAVIGLGSTVVRHPFWSKKGEERREELSAFLTRGAVTAGAVFAATDRRGKPSMAWQYQNWREHREDLAIANEEFEAQLEEVKAKAKEKVAKAKS